MGRFFVQIMGVERGPYAVEELDAMVDRGEIHARTVVREDGSERRCVAADVPGLYSSREWLTAVILSIFLGGFGVDRFYVGDTVLGVLKLVTLSACIVALVGLSYAGHAPHLAHVDVQAGAVNVAMSDYWPLQLAAIAVFMLWKIIDIILFACDQVLDGQGRRLRR